jgi:RNA recognition motif-containing protein
MTRAQILFIDGLPLSTDSDKLKAMFQPFGTVLQARTMAYHGGRSMGCGYVMMATEAQATQALDALNGTGGVLRVCRPPLPIAETHSSSS